METHLHSVLTVVMLFVFGLISPGPNFLVVAQTALNFGRVAGVPTGLDAALGDAVYASVGLFGVTRAIDMGSCDDGHRVFGWFVFNEAGSTHALISSN